MNSERNIVLVAPGHEESHRAIRDGLSKRRAVVIIGSCGVRYQGRASSTLKEGERIVLVKEDGNVLVHRPTGLDPVNYMPSADGEERYESRPTGRKTRGCLFETKVVRGKLLLRVVRRRPREIIRIYFNRLFMVGVLDLVDEGEFYLYASEQDMQSAILANPELIEEGFRPISYEKRVEPGFVDVYGEDVDGRLVVLEIKRRTAGKGTALQLARYIEAIKGNSGREVRGIIVAPSLARGVQPLLATLNLEFKALSPKRCAQILGMEEREKRLDSYLR